MSIIETVLVFVGIPALVILIIIGLVFAGADVSRGKRYRPGRPFEFRPVWFLSAPETLADESRDEHKALGGADAPAALPAGGSTAAAEWAARRPAEQRATGGASDRW